MMKNRSRIGFGISGPSVPSGYTGVHGHEQEDGQILWRPYKKLTGRYGSSVQPIGSKKYLDEEQAATAYDEHMFRTHGYNSDNLSLTGIVLNFDAENYRDLEERDRAEKQAIQKELARQRHLVNLQG